MVTLDQTVQTEQDHFTETAQTKQDQFTPHTADGTTSLYTTLCRQRDDHFTPNYVDYARSLCSRLDVFMIWRAQPADSKNNV